MSFKKIAKFAVIILVVLVAGVACSKTDSSIAFTDGESKTIAIGDTFFLNLLANNADTVGAKLTSSDPSVVQVLDMGYVKGVASGMADITVSVGKLSATIKIEVSVPQIADSNIFYGNVNLSVHKYLLVQTSSGQGKAYAMAKQNGTKVGEATAEFMPNGCAYIPISQLVQKGGVYQFGLARMGGGDIEFATLTDSNASYSLLNGEDWTFYNAESTSKGRLSIINNAINHGGASITLDIQQDEQGTILNPFIYVSATSGSIWSVKIRRGDGVNDLYEFVLLGDSPVSEHSSCEVDLTKHANYVSGGKVTLVIYTVEGTLTLDRIVQHTGDNTYSDLVVKEQYVPLERITISVPDKLRVGSTYSVTAKFMPSDASFKDFELVSSSNAISVSGKRFSVLASGECELSCVGFGGEVYGTLSISTTIAPTSIAFLNNGGGKLVSLSSGSFNLAPLVRVLPDNSTDKEVRYTINSDTTGSASVSASGVVSFSSEGEIVVRVTSKDVSSASALFSLTVANATIVYASSVEIGLEGGGAIPTTLDVGSTIVANATVLPSNATTKEVIWISSNPSVAEVTADGAITAVGGGSVTIYCYSKDGAVVSSVDIEVYSGKEFEVGNGGYAIITLSDNLLSDDEVIVSISRGIANYSFSYIIPEEEKDVNNSGSMVAQRRVLIDLSAEFFAQAGTYTASITATRDGVSLSGYYIVKIDVFATSLDISSADGWTDGYQATALSDEDGFVVQLTGGGFGNIEYATSKSATSNARYLVINVAGGTAQMFATKIKIGDTEYNVTGGDCTGLGVYIFDLSTVSGFNSATDFSVCLYVIGENATTIEIAGVFFVS